MAVQGVTLVPKIATGDVVGPASYAAGGFLLDLSAQFVSLDWLKLTLVTPGALVPVELEVLLDRDLAGLWAPGKATVRLVRDRYDKATTGAVSGQPGGVTVQAAKTATATVTGSSHSHNFTHNHGATESFAATPGGGGVNAVGTTPPLDGHSHTVDLPSLTVATGAATHTHDRSFEYQHDHSLTDAVVDLTLAEIAAATNLSGTTWRFIAIGQGDQ